MMFIVSQFYFSFICTIVLLVLHYSFCTILCWIYFPRSYVCAYLWKNLYFIKRLIIYNCSFQKAEHSFLKLPNFYCDGIKSNFNFWPTISASSCLLMTSVSSGTMFSMSSPLISLLAKIKLYTPQELWSVCCITFLYWMFQSWGSMHKRYAILLVRILILVSKTEPYPSLLPEVHWTNVSNISIHRTWGVSLAKIQWTLLRQMTV